MGGSLSHANNKLSFSFEDYIEERRELAELFREIAKAASEHRQNKGRLQVINGASGVTAGVAGAVALALSPVTFGASVPAAAVVATAIVSNSIAAASLTSSVASYGYGRGGDDDIERRLANLECIIDCISQQDAEVNSWIQTLERQNVEPAIKACHQLRTKNDQTEATEKRPLHVDLPLSVLKSQGLFMGTHSIVQGTKLLQEEEELETALVDFADALDEESKTLETLKYRCKYLACVPTLFELPRGRLSFVNASGGGYGKTMVVEFSLDGGSDTDDDNESKTTLRSDSSNVLFLPRGATSLRIHFEWNGNKLNKVDRMDPKYPWIKNEQKECVVDVFDFNCGDGVDAVFVLHGNIRRSYVCKAWDFGRHPWSTPREWEWWGNSDKDLKEIMPDLEARLAKRKARYEPAGPCGIDFTACGSCLGPSAIAAVEP